MNNCAHKLLNKVLVISLLCIAALCAPMNSNATPMIVELRDVTFDDGTMARGWFEFDPSDIAAQFIPRWDITTDDSPFWSSVNYNSFNKSNPLFHIETAAFSDPRSFHFLDTAPFGAIGGDRQNELEMTVNLESLEGQRIWPLYIGELFSEEDFISGFPGGGPHFGYFRLITSGYLEVVEGVPEPATVALFSVGLAGAVAMRRRSKKNAP